MVSEFQQKKTQLFFFGAAKKAEQQGAFQGVTMRNITY